MFRFISRLLYRMKHPRPKVREIDPDQIFLDSQTFRHSTATSLKGALNVRFPAARFGALFCVFMYPPSAFGRTYALQAWEANSTRNKSAQNRLRHTLIFGSRGVFYDRPEPFSRGTSLTKTSLNSRNGSIWVRLGSRIFSDS